MTSTPPMSDTERVLGQIERGEVRVGPGAAREIAAAAEAAYGSAWPRRRRANHAASAARARTQPGTWVLVGEYGSLQSAKATAWVIRTAATSKPGMGQYYAPRGAFETETRLTAFGCEVHVRFVGEPAVSADDEAWAEALAALNGGGA